MQPQGFTLLLFILLGLPVFLLTSDHNIFFVILSVFLLFTSIQRLTGVFFPAQAASSESDEGTTEELEESLHINIRRFNVGLGVAKNLIVLLFLLYCTFFIHHMIAIVLISAVIAFRIFDTMKLLLPRLYSSEHIWIRRLSLLYALLMDLSMVALIIFVAWNKFISLVF